MMVGHVRLINPVVNICALFMMSSASGEVLVSRVAASMADRSSTWIVSEQPRTLWQDEPLPTEFVSKPKASTARPTNRSESQFSLADVPSEKLAETRDLLSELNARPVDGAIVVDLPGDVLFDFDKDVLRADAIEVLNKVGALLASFSDRAISIHGHTDSKGDDAYNDALSLRRAERVRDFLDKHASSGRDFSVYGFGEKKPVAANEKPDGSDDPQGRQKNRRVEILIADNSKE
jgi:outer membrane protein OmpA-like peptidoglycan-associated protein